MNPIMSTKFTAMRYREPLELGARSRGARGSSGAPAVGAHGEYRRAHQHQDDAVRRCDTHVGLPEAR